MLIQSLAAQAINLTGATVTHLRNQQQKLKTSNNDKLFILVGYLLHLSQLVFFFFFLFSFSPREEKGGQKGEYKDCKVYGRPQSGKVTRAGVLK